MGTTSFSLLERLRADERDESAWSQFVSIYHGLFENFLSQRGVPLSVAEEVRQDAMVVVLRDVASFVHNGQRGAFRRWLREILRNRLKSHVRSATRHERLVSTYGILEMAKRLGDDASDLSQAWDKEHDQFVVQQLLNKISSDFQPQTILAFRKVVLEQSSVEDVARETGVAPVSVRVAVARVLRRLREEGQQVIDSL